MMHCVGKTKKGLIHCIAVCKDCSWREEAYTKAARAAASHVKKTGHVVGVDQGFVYSVYPLGVDLPRKHL